MGRDKDRIEAGKTGFAHAENFNRPLRRFPYVNASYAVISGPHGPGGLIDCVMKVEPLYEG